MTRLRRLSFVTAMTLAAPVLVALAPSATASTGQPVATSKSAKAPTPAVTRKLKAPIGATIGSYGVSADLNCSLTDSNAVNQFYGQTACGTFVSVAGAVYGPANIPAGGVGQTGYTPLSQTTTGTGTDSDPYVITTVVDAGTTGLRLTERDAFSTDGSLVRSRVDIRNRRDTDRELLFSHAADCYTANQDAGYGMTGDVPHEVSGEVGCRSADAYQMRGTTAVEFLPVTPGSHYNEDNYSANWQAIAAGAPALSDTCTCTTYQDNGMSLQWAANVAAHKQTTIVFQTRLQLDLLRSTYVALGDSYSSGEGAPAESSPIWLSGTDEDDNECHRSAKSWPATVADESLADAPFGFHACSGAVLADLNAPNHSNAGESAPQLSWLSERTGIVTITIGGNDAHFADVMGYCAFRWKPFSNSCEEEWSERVDDAIDRITDPNEADGTLYSAYEDIHEDAPNARIFVVGYPRFFPDDPPDDCRTGVLRYNFKHDDMLWINSEIQKMDERIQEAVDATPGAQYVDIYDALADHDICADDDRWINRASIKHQEYSYHPNREGQRAIADIVESRLYGGGGGGTST